MTAAPSQPGAPGAGAGTSSGAGATGGQVRALLRAEGAAVFVAILLLYGQVGFSWIAFVVLFLAPDLSMLAYLAGPRIGATVYNAAHTYVLPIAVALVGYFAERTVVAPALALIWIAHIGLDRALGYGLKYPTRFGDTHLGLFGKR